MGSESSNKDLTDPADPGIRSGGAERESLPKGTLCDFSCLFFDFLFAFFLGSW